MSSRRPGLAPPSRKTLNGKGSTSTIGAEVRSPPPRAPPVGLNTSGRSPATGKNKQPTAVSNNSVGGAVVGGGAVISLESPCIEPTSGMYCPPVVVTITHPWGNINQIEEENSHPGGRRSPGLGQLQVFYSIQSAASADKIASQTGYNQQRERHRYTGPFALKSVGRVKVTAVAMVMRTDGCLESPVATALYALDYTAPPPVSLSQGGLYHKAAIPLPQVQAVPTFERVLVDSDGREVNASGEFPAGVREEVVLRAPGGRRLSDSPSRHDLTGYPNHTETNGRQPEHTTAYPLLEHQMLRFVDFPDQVHCYKPFDVTMYLVDPHGYPVSSPVPAGEQPQLALSADVIVKDGQQQQHHPRSSSFNSPVVVANVEGDFTPTTHSPVSWSFVHNVICSENQTALHRASGPGGGGYGSSTVGNQWNAVACATNLIGVKAAHCGARWRITSLSRVIVGLYDDTDSQDPLEEATWKTLTYSFHFSADLDDPTLLPAYRIYERGCLVKSIDTRDFHVGDTFGMKVRTNGRVSYYHNDEVIHTSGVPVSQSTKADRLSLQCRIAAQQGTPAVSEIELVDAETPCLFRLKGIVWHPVSAAAQADTVSERLGVLRAWIVGYDFVPAVVRVPLIIAPVPRWGFAAATLASMFALGTFGFQGQAVAPKLRENQSRTPMLSLIRERPKGAGGEEDHNVGGGILAPELGPAPSSRTVPFEEQMTLNSPVVTDYPSSPLNKRQRGQQYQMLSDPTADRKLSQSQLSRRTSNAALDTSVRSALGTAASPPLAVNTGSGAPPPPVASAAPGAGGWTTTAVHPLLTSHPVLRDPVDGGDLELVQPLPVQGAAPHHYSSYESRGGGSPTSPKQNTSASPTQFEGSPEPIPLPVGTFGPHRSPVDSSPAAYTFARYAHQQQPEGSPPAAIRGTPGGHSSNAQQQEEENGSPKYQFEYEEAHRRPSVERAYELGRRNPSIGGQPVFPVDDYDAVNGIGSPIGVDSKRHQYLETQQKDAYNAAPYQPMTPRHQGAGAAEEDSDIPLPYSSRLAALLRKDQPPPGNDYGVAASSTQPRLKFLDESGFTTRPRNDGGARDAAAGNGW